MKKLFFKHGAFLLLLILVLASPQAIKADSTSVPVTYVDDVSTYFDYIPTDITYSTQQINTKQVLSLKLDKPTSMLLAITNIDVYDYNKNSSGSITVEIYKEKELLNKLFSVGKSSSKAIYEGTYYMDPGTYYVCVTPSSNACYGTYRIAALGQLSGSEEKNIPSTQKNPNAIEPNSTFYGYLSNIHDTDYYVFALGEDMLTNLYVYRLDGSGSATFTILDSNYTELNKITMSSTYGENKLSTYLHKGTYFIKVNNNNYGGNYRATISTEKYSLKVTKSTSKKTNQSINLYVDANFKISNGRIINAKDFTVTKNNMADSTTWRQGASISNTAVVSANGTYFILVCDSDGNCAFVKYKVTNIDTKAPAVPKVTYCKLGGTKVKGTGEKNASILIRITRNGVTQEYTGKVNSKGKYAVKTDKILRGSVVTVWLCDAAGNYSKGREITIR